MEFRHKQIAPPKNWDLFEDLCLALFRALWRDPMAQRHGRNGQAQHGVDIFGSQDSQGVIALGVQCKGKDRAYGRKATVKELSTEIVKAERFTPSLNHFVFATTADKDGPLQRAAWEISRKRVAAGKFSVTVLGWSDIQNLLADAPAALQAFYPEHVFDLPGLIAALRDLPRSDDVRAMRDALQRLGAIATPSAGAMKWLPVTFATTRDLGPALMGRALGPADAAACPTLPEAKALVEELKRAYSVRLAGEAGLGKSVCAFQAARILADEGWKVLRLADPNVAEISLVPSDLRTLYLIDDAHLTAPWVLAAAEADANRTRLVLSTHNVVEHAAPGRGAIKLEGKRAVRVIAAALRANLAATLKIVRRVDDSIGEHSISESLENRIDHAETTADRPWQFCFILGGGWRRAEQAARNAHAQGADIVLAAASIRQIASRDARCSRPDLLRLLSLAGIDAAAAEHALHWLMQERLLIAAQDNRTPHQRFASVVIGQVLRGQDDAGRSQIAALYQAVLQDATMPLIGLRNLLLELRMTQFGAWRGLAPAASLDWALQRCWRASEADRAGALFFLSEACGYLPAWPRGVLAGQLDLLGDWISLAARQSCYALGQLLNAVFNSDRAYAGELVGHADPSRVAAALAAVAPANAFEMGALLSNLANAAPAEWKKSLAAALQHKALLRLARRWRGGETIGSFAKLVSALHAFDKTLALDMVAAFLPTAAKALAADPARAFHEFDDVAWHVIKGFDPLGIYKDRPQSARERQLCRKLCAPLYAEALAARISATDKRDYQSAAFFLAFLHNAAPRKFAFVVRAIDWAQIGVAIGSDWKALFHDADILLWIAHRDPVAGPAIASLIEQYLPMIEVLTPKLAIMSPGAAQKQISAGRKIGLSSKNGHFHWVEAAIVIGQLYEARPELVDALLKDLIADAGATLSQEHPSWYRDGALLIQVLRQIAPDAVQRILDGVDVAKAETGWAAALTSADDMRRPIALLIESALNRSDAVGAMARRLRSRLGKTSRPARKDLKRFDL